MSDSDPSKFTGSVLIRRAPSVDRVATPLEAELDIADDLAGLFDLDC